MADLDQVLRALGHPLRRRILAALVEEPRSATSLSQEFRMELSSVAYHLNKVLDKEYEIVELVDAIPRRGALEKFFQVKVDALREDAFEAGERTLTLEECVFALVIGVAPLPGSCGPIFGP